MPLLPPGAIFHSSASSKFLNCSLVMMSPPGGPTRVNAPSLTCQPAGSAVCLYPRHPAPDVPSNSNCQPAPRSASVSRFEVPGVIVTCGATGGGGGAVWQLALASSTAVTSDLWICIMFMRGALQAPGAAPARRGGLARCE